ncbi:hypothetical protein K490DRAFT_73249 [Saccharata proteae CBS 121410]|uniref:C2H2-type domain-containing protein n=1 Tax=Saccharata proteae CBS 121410 TaxID=1314787 RepID=A0A9P4HXJ4_9PEZI|nr:hypothetical protein K490DRAFT_73249 [Saccharata proteae CBS 121410]
MSANQTHPRRRPQKGSAPQSVPSLPHHTNFRKHGTFHSPKNVSCDLVDPIANACLMPKRSETNPLSLEQILIDAGQNRVSDLLTSVDNVLSGKTSSAADASILKDDNVHPVPTFMLNNHSFSAPDPMDIDKKPVVVDHHHASDSGLGSSISASLYGMVPSYARARTRRSVRSSASAHSAVTKSYSHLSSNGAARAMSKEAIDHIKNRIVKPILREPSLKEFHPLINQVPHRIGSKDINNLRDLEKTLIFLAPVSSDDSCLDDAVAHLFCRIKDYAASPTKYLRFCERSITFIANTVDYLNEADQRLPTDRPYTNNYFLDLVEQIRRYAAIMAATRRKEKAGEPLSEKDYCPNEKITLRGGISHNGKPAELVREKNGKVIPIANDFERATTSAKRAHDDDEVEDDIHRSMARRRKSEKPGDVMHVCADCRKEFKRPCDLTKHEKTHSRPWKCPDGGCKYHAHGWPTEKERDRHVNDKHTAAPPQYKCIFAPCTYASKRESNCKQHMEKAHGWEYVRSKANGRVKNSSASSSRTPQTPLTPFIPTPASAFAPLSTPVTPLDNSPSVASYHDFGFSNYAYTPAVVPNDFDDFRRESVTTAGTGMTFSSNPSPFQAPTSFDEAITPPETGFDHSTDVMFDPSFNFNTTFQQQPTPALSNYGDAFGEHFQPLFAPSTTNANGSMPPPAPTSAFSADMQHLSPTAQPDQMLFQSNDMHMDEGFGGDDFMPAGDFTLFDNSAAQTCGSGNGEASTAAGDLFHDLSNFGTFGGQFENAYLPGADGFGDRSGELFNFDLGGA